MSTMYILWLRQLKRYIRSKARMVASLAQPVLFLMSILFTAVFSGIEIIWDKQFGFLKETLVAPVSRFNIMMGRTLGGATVAFIQGIVVFLITLLVGFRPVSLVLLPVAIVLMFIVALLFTAIGTAIASLMDDMQGFPLIMNFLVMPLFFLSGALFPLDQLTSWLAFITKLNPLSYGIDGIRYALAGTSHFNIATDFSVLVVVTFVCIVIGAYLFSKIEI